VDFIVELLIQFIVQVLFEILAESVLKVMFRGGSRVAASRNGRWVVGTLLAVLSVMPGAPTCARWLTGHGSYG